MLKITNKLLICSLKQIQKTLQKINYNQHKQHLSFYIQQNEKSNKYY